MVKLAVLSPASIATRAAVGIALTSTWKRSIDGVPGASAEPVEAGEGAGAVELVETAAATAPAAAVELTAAVALAEAVGFAAALELADAVGVAEVVGVADAGGLAEAVGLAELVEAAEARLAVAGSFGTTLFAPPQPACSSAIARAAARGKVRGERWLNMVSCVIGSLNWNLTLSVTYHTGPLRGYSPTVPLRGNHP
jgi:hypothetical protein